MIFLHDVLNYVLPCWSFTSYFCISKFLENDIFTNTKKMKLSLSLSVWSDFMQMSLLHISVFMGPPNHCHFFHVCNGVWKLPCIRCSRCPHCKYLKLLHPKYTEEVIYSILHWWSNQQLTFCLCCLRAAILDHQFYISILPP